MTALLSVHYCSRERLEILVKLDLLVLLVDMVALGILDKRGNMVHEEKQ